MHPTMRTVAFLIAAAGVFAAGFLVARAVF